MKKILIALCLLVFVFFGSIPKIDFNIIPDKVDEIKKPIVDIEKPTEEILKKVSAISEIVKDKEDRVKLGLFNYELSNRIAGYNTDCQQFNDLYANAGVKFFNGSMKGKYSKLSSLLEELFQSVITSDNHVLNNEEKENLKKTLSGLAWILLER